MLLDLGEPACRPRCMVGRAAASPQATAAAHGPLLEAEDWVADFHLAELDRLGHVPTAVADGPPLAPCLDAMLDHAGISQTTGAGTPTPALPSVDRAPSTPRQPGSRDVAAFIDSIMLPMQPPLLASPPVSASPSPGTRIGCLGAVGSTRLAAKTASRLAQPEAQATKVMLMKMGVENYVDRSDNSAHKKFQDTFTRPLSSARREAMRELFPGRRRRAAA